MAVNRKNVRIVPTDLENSEQVKISQLPLATDLDGLKTIGVDKNNESVAVDLTFIKESSDAANDAADKANAAANRVDAAIDSANQATNRANEAALRTEQAIEGANQATGNANQASSAANSTVDRLEELEESLINAAKMMPTSMTVDYPEKITLGNLVAKIVAKLFPGNYERNVLFQSDNVAIDALPDGAIIPLKTGRSRIHCIPTENTTLYKTIYIDVVASSARLTGGGAFRLTSSGKIRLT